MILSNVNYISYTVMILYTVEYVHESILGNIEYGLTETPNAFFKSWHFIARKLSLVKCTLRRYRL